MSSSLLLPRSTELQDTADCCCPMIRKEQFLEMNEESPTQVKDFLKVSEHPSREDVISQSLFEIDVVMDDILKEEEEASSIAAPPTLKRYSTVNSVELHDLSLDSLQQELVDAEQELKSRHTETVKENLEILSLELRQTNEREAELRRKVKRLQQQSEEQRALKERIYHTSSSITAFTTTTTSTTPQQQQEDQATIPISSSPTNLLKDAFLSFFNDNTKIVQEHEDEDLGDDELAAKMDLVERMERKLKAEAAARQKRGQKATAPFWGFSPLSQGILPC